MKTKQNLTIEEAARLLRDGEVVAFPTETVYGLGAIATSDAAIAKIYAAKGRPDDNPLIVHIGAIRQVRQAASSVPPAAKQLMDAFWPGPLTIILPKQAGLSETVTAGLDTVGVRLPAHPIALALLKAVNLPVAAPSANVSGRPSPTTAQHVADDLTGKIAGIVDGGPSQIGLESTVIDCTVTPPVILRPGGVTKAEIEAVIGRVLLAESAKEMAEAPKSPGMKYTHYAPKAPMVIVQGGPDLLRRVIAQAQGEGKRVGVLVTEERQGDYPADVVLTCGRESDVSSVAGRLYDALREFDAHDLDIIFAEPFPTEGIGEAIQNRLQKASGHRTIAD